MLDVGRCSSKASTTGGQVVTTCSKGDAPGANGVADAVDTGTESLSSDARQDAGVCGDVESNGASDNMK